MPTITNPPTPQIDRPGNAPTPQRDQNNQGQYAAPPGSSTTPTPGSSAGKAGRPQDDRDPNSPARSTQRPGETEAKDTRNATDQDANAKSEMCDASNPANSSCGDKPGQDV